MGGAPGQRCAGYSDCHVLGVKMLADDYTVAMPEQLNAHIAARPKRWVLVQKFASPWGGVSLYRNVDRT
jgi:hypothetical protein